MEVLELFGFTAQVGFAGRESDVQEMTTKAFWDPQNDPYAIAEREAIQNEGSLPPLFLKAHMERIGLPYEF